MMQINQVKDVIMALYAWTSGVGTIRTLERLLGDRIGSLEYMLHENGLVNSWGKPHPDYSQQALVDIVLLYLAMRHG